MLRPVALAALVVLIGSSQGCRRTTDGPPLTLDVVNQGPLVFPPSDAAWLDREPISAPHHAKKDQSEPIRLETPALDDEDYFEIEGRYVHLRFSEDVVDPTTRAKAPALKITPPVRGKTVWTWGNEVAFHAEKPFDPETTYTISLPELTAPSGKKLEGGLTAKFKATPIVEIAGKIIHYLPKPGHARVVAVLPGDDAQIGRGQEIAVLYDQPVDLGLAAKLVSFADDKGAPIAATIRHPNADVFDGVSVDRRIVVLAKPAPRPTGSVIELTARPQQKEDAEPIVHTMTVARPPAFEEIVCASGCTVEGKTARGGAAMRVAVRFNNSLGIRWSEGAKYVRFTPPARNLYVDVNGSELELSGSLEPSTTYFVHVEGLRDSYGAIVPPVDVQLVTDPLPVSMTIGERVMLLDEATTKSFTVTTRNVEKGELAFWPIEKGDARAFAQALSSGPPSTAPITIPFTPAQRRDTLVDTAVDLSTRLEPDRAYVAQVRSLATVANAPAPGTQAEEVAVIHTGGPRAMGAHVHEIGSKAVVQVFRLGTGEPVAGAVATIGAASATTDASGTALVARTAADDTKVVRIVDGPTELMVPLEDKTAVESKALFPAFSSTTGEERPRDAVGALVVDRGVYRPGSKMFVKGIVRKREGEKLRALPGGKVRLRVIDPADSEHENVPLVTDERGAVTSEIVFDPRGHTGRYQIRLELDDGKHSLLASEEVRVAAFDAPRFKVDVEAAKAEKDRIAAKISAKYLFGEAMKGAPVSWILRKRSLPVKGGVFEAAGLSFERDTPWWDAEESRRDELRPITGETTLGADGTTTLQVAPGPLPNGPVEITLEADVTDASYRHVAGHLRIVKDPVERHAGLKLSHSFGDRTKPLEVRLGVVDRDGAPISGVRVGARLDRIGWTRSAEKAESGAIVERWHETLVPSGSCETTSAAEPVSCTLTVPSAGSYRVTARAFGRDHASAWFYAWGGNDGGGVPSAGKKIPVALDKTRYAAGETARVLVQSPYPAATALLTVEQGDLLRHETRRITGPSATFDVPLTEGHAPWVHAAVTLLPIGVRDPDYRVGVVRIPVSASETKLDVKVASDKPTYRTREEAEVTIEVKRAGVPVKDADVVLAVVDEGVLRLTGFHAKDPARSLRVGWPLSFRAVDSRGWILRRREKAHVAGGGDSEGEDALDTRRDFVETAAWLPNLRTDGEGRIKTKVKLPDNLTEFRMMAVAIDDEVGTGTAESSFVVTKPVLLDPVMPRFAQRGDRFEAAAIVHNTTDAPVAAKVTIAGRAREVTVPPHDRTRVSVPMSADANGKRTIAFALDAFGAPADRVEVPLRIEEPGVEEHPQISGVFAEQQEITLAIPEDALFEDDAFLSVKTGSAIYPEVGQRLTYLLGYPHGCVEQTTSSTLPLIAAKTLVPWTGIETLPEPELRKRIEAGIERLASMQTPTGGLAYWPGQTENNTFGSAYALRAILRAKEMGITRPGLAEGVTRWLASRVPYEQDKNVRLAIAEVLARAGALPEGSADALWDARDELDTFGLATAAIALSSLPKQKDRVEELIDRVEKSFDADGTPKSEHGEHDYHYWGSHDRDRAQALIALVKLRPKSPLAGVLARRLSKKLATYTTQSNAWSLLALADYVGGREPSASIDVSLLLEGRILDTTRKLPGNNKEVRIPLRDLVGKKTKLLLRGDGKTPAAFALEARYKRPYEAAASRAGKRAPAGVSIHRVFTDPEGKPVDLAQIKAGQALRVALRIELPTIAQHQRGYLAVVDRLPAGLEPIETDLATAAHVAGVSGEHPFHDGLTRGYGARPSHIDRRDDRVQIYFDRIGYEKVVYATYVVRATTPGEFVAPPCHGELMYEAGSEGYSDATRITIR